MRQPLPHPPLMLITGDVAGGADLTKRCLQAIEGGIRWIQIRAVQGSGDSLPARIVCETAQRLLQNPEVTVVINDRLDTALAVGSGLHLRADGIETAQVRRLIPNGRLLGRSVHSWEEIDAIGPLLDYVQIGPVFDTASKRRYGAPLGTGQVTAAARKLGEHADRAALVAVGGIDERHIEKLAGCGADGAAVIGAIWNVADVAAAAATLTDRAKLAWPESRLRGSS